MDVVLPQLFVGLSLGAILLLVALGLTFTFGQMNVINMAHGEFLMAGAYTAYTVQQLLGPEAATRSFVVALPGAFVVGGLLGLLLERTLIRRLYGRPLDTLLVTFGVALALQQAARDIFGAPNVQVVAPAWLGGGLTVAGVQLPYTRLFILGLVVVAITAVAVFIHVLPAGRRMRAVMQDRELAGTSGIATPRVDASTFVIGSGLAGVAGVALTLLGPIGPTIGIFYLVDAFLVVIVGGLGRLWGAVVAAFGLGILNSFVEFTTGASLAKAILFVAVVVFLQFRPQGVSGVRSRALA
ncbi:MAG: urea ABC transporter permease subunit UrtB [Actinobacteria bacterium]|nr:urea ABC transporter permease subunit UrtB [Actinomycetota bacterium]MDP9022023.1 urea ABC transporter permease subunit UrtB [Actinomycetota bacterium]